MTTNNTILDLTTRRRLIRQRLRSCPWPALAEQLRCELREVEGLILEADARRVDELRERLTPGEYDDGFIRPFGQEAAK